MSHKNRLLLMVVLPAALIFAGCKSGSSGTGPDSGAPGSPDADFPDSPEQPVGVILTVNPPSVGLGAIDPGVTSSPVTVTVTNEGSAMSGPLSVTVSGTGIMASGCDGVVLAPKESCKLSVTVRLTVPGPVSGTIEVGDNPYNTKRIAVSGIGPGGPDWSLSPSPLDLGAVITGRTATGTMVLTNTSHQDLTGFVISISGVGFALSPTGTCTDTLAVDQSCSIDVSFTADPTLGRGKGTLSVSQGGVTRTVALSATVSSFPQWDLTPSSAVLQTTVGTPSSPVTFTISRGAGAMHVAISGVNMKDFSFTTDCDKPLVGDVSGTCQVTVVYNPATAPTTNSTATLTVTDLGTGLSATATLTGTALNCGAGSGIMGTSTDFGDVAVGSTSAPLTFTIWNPGGEDLTGLKISTNISQFAVSTDDCTGKVIAPGSQCTIAVQFTPAAGDNGAIQGQIKAIWGGPCSTAWRGVVGSAVPPAKALWDQARIGNTGTSWWMNVVKGKFFLSIKLRNSWVDDSAGRAEAVGIAKLLASKSGSTALDLIPKLIELPGTWIYDPSYVETQAGPVVATTYEQAINYIDGGAAPFYESGVTAKVLAWGNYLETDSDKDAPYSLDLRIWEMASASDAGTLYATLLKNSLYSPDNVPWETCQGGDAANPCP